jgi:RHS repeat-associated protein
MKLRKDNDIIAAVAFEVDALGRRVEAVRYDQNLQGQWVETVQRYYYDEQRAAVQTTVSGGTETDSRYYVFGNYIDEVLVMLNLAGTPADIYCAHDPLYSPVALFAANGTVAERCEYDAYGQAQFLTSNFYPLPSSQHANPYTFTGRELDSLDAGSCTLMYYRARTYDPQTGRFMQRDPLGIDPAGGDANPFDIFKQYSTGMNIYEYVHNSPFIYCDPYGLRPKPGDIAKRIIGFQLCRLAGCLAAVTGIEIMCDIYLDDEDWARCTCEVMAESTLLRILCFGYRNRIMDAFQCSSFGIDY